MDIISPKMDSAFRELMEDDEVRRYFICDVLNMPVDQVRETRLGNSFLRRRHHKMKQGILDVKVFLHDGTRINLEMQLRRCVGISILDFDLTEDARYHSVYRMRDEMEKITRICWNCTS